MDLGTPPIKRSVTLHGHRTSITMEEIFWIQLQKIAKSEGKSINKVIALIDEKRGENSLSSALRIYILEKLLSVS
tara:strand:- start:1131 stop:1355 length:225 start_codon:yes stop_codon:yes gene_type:complete